MDPLSITASTITVIQSISAAYKVIKQLKGLPKAFNQVGDNLPLVEDTLEAAHARLEKASLDASSKKAIEPVTQRCQEKAKALRDIFQEVERGRKDTKDAKDWSALASFYRTKVLPMGKASRVEALMHDILCGLRGLAIHHLFKAATEKQLEKLEKAIQDLSAVEPSLPDSDFEKGSTANIAQTIESGGTGYQFPSTDWSTQHINFGTSFSPHMKKELTSGPLVNNNHYIPIAGGGNQQSVILSWLQSICPPLRVEDTHNEKLQIADKAPGTGEWLLNSPKFIKWRDNEPRKLWCHGILGAGKTVLAAKIINHLQVGYSRSKNIACLYIYFDYIEHKNQGLTSLLSTLLIQLLRMRNGLSAKILEIHDAWGTKRMFPSSDDYTAMLKSQLTEFSRVFIVIDALDECPDDTRSSFVKTLDRLPDKVHVLYTTTPGRSHGQLIRPGGSEIEVIAHPDDIRKYLKKTINDRQRLRAMAEAGQQVDHAFLDKALDTIVTKSDGMFLLAHLHIEFLASNHTPQGFKKGIAHLPRTPDEVYHAALERIQRQNESNRSLAYNVLTWLVFAEKRLTISELTHALTIQDHVKAIQAGEDLPVGNLALTTEYALTSACAGIVIVDKDSQLVRLAHYTVEEYLYKHQSAIFEDAQSKMARTCLVCLMHLPPKHCATKATPEKELQDRRRKYPFLQYAAEHWSDHVALGVRGTVYPLAWKFLNDARYKHQLATALQLMADIHLRHETDVSGLHMAAYFGLVNLVEKALSQNKPIHLNARTARGETPLHWAVQRRQTTFARFLVSQNVDLNASDANEKTALHKAIAQGDASTVDVLLSTSTGTNKRVNLKLKDSHGWTPLRWAAAYGQLDIVEKLLRAGAEVDARDKDGFTALRWTAYRGHMGLALLLIQNSDRAALERPCRDEWTVLRWAAQGGREKFIQLLVEKRVDLDVGDKDGWTALRWAVWYGHSMPAWLLMRAGADVNKTDVKGLTALHSAAERCYLSSGSGLVWLLLENGALVNAQSTRFGYTPLHFAASKGNESVVWLLLERGADPGLVDLNKRTALHWALNEGNTKVAKLLIWKAEGLIRAADDEKRTALHLAASVGNLDAVVSLLDNGARLDARDREGNTPLHLAVFQQHEQVVTCLLGRGADANIENKKKQTPNHIATSSGYTTIAATLGQSVRVGTAMQRVETPELRERSRSAMKSAGNFAARVHSE
ncbi:hypothetical protein DL768_004226 [Monosporascus sp. mg162]|nr:hypothetical protein DL768_004226 [Monosporascus sp. mg162]